MTLLEVKDLDVVIASTPVLHEMNLFIGEKEVAGIIGPNGAGKTTLCSAIAGVIPHKGHIYFKGKDISRLSCSERVRLGISLCPQEGHLFHRLSVEDNLMLGAYTNRAESKSLIQDVLEYFPALKDKLKRPCHTLSGGERQMVAISRALMSAPQLLILDEPSLGLAPKVNESLIKAVKKIREDFGCSILLTEQNIDFVLKLVDKITVMRGGRVQIKEFKPRSRDEVLKAYFGYI